MDFNQGLTEAGNGHMADPLWGHMADPVCSFAAPIDYFAHKN